MKYSGVEWALNPMTGVLKEEEKRHKNRDTCRETALWPCRQILDRCIYKPRDTKDAKSTRIWERGKEGPDFTGSTTLLTPRFQTSVPLEL